MYARWARMQYAVSDALTPYSEQHALDVDPTNGYAPNYYELNLTQGARYLIKVEAANETYKPLQFLMRNGFRGAKVVDQYTHANDYYLVFDVEDSDPYYLRVSQAGGNENIGDGEYTITISQISKEPINLTYDYQGGELNSTDPSYAGATEAYPFVRIDSMPYIAKDEMIFRGWSLEGSAEKWDIEEDFFTGDSSSVKFSALWTPLPSALCSLNTTYTGDFHDALLFGDFDRKFKAFKFEGEAGKRYQFKVTLSQPDVNAYAAAMDVKSNYIGDKGLVDSSQSEELRSYTCSFVPPQDGIYYFFLFNFDEDSSGCTYEATIRSVPTNQVEIIYHENSGKLYDLDYCARRLSAGSYLTRYDMPLRGTRPGYILSGYSLNSEGTQKIDMNSFTMPKTTLNLYAVWDKIECEPMAIPSTIDATFTLTDKPTFEGLVTRGDLYEFALKKGVTYTFLMRGNGFPWISMRLYDAPTLKRVGFTNAHTPTTNEPYFTIKYTPTEDQNIYLSTITEDYYIETRDIPYTLEVTSNETNGSGDSGSSGTGDTPSTPDGPDAPQPGETGPDTPAINSKIIVVFSAGCGTPSSIIRELNSGDKIGVLPRPVRAGYVFLGYFTEQTGGEKISADTVAKEITTYYAHWRKKSSSATLSGVRKSSGSWARPLTYKTFSKKLVLSSKTRSVKLVPVTKSKYAKVYGKVGTAKYQRITSLSARISRGKTKLFRFKVVSENRKYVKYYSIYVTRR